MASYKFEESSFEFFYIVINARSKIINCACWLIVSIKEQHFTPVFQESCIWKPHTQSKQYRIDQLFPQGAYPHQTLNQR